MKKLIFILLAVSHVSLAVAQTAHIKNVPVLVKNGFNKLFPNADGVTWLKMREQYQATFKLDHSDATALMDAEGNLVELHTTIAVNELPSGVKEYVSKHFPSTDISAASMIKDGAGKITYEAIAMGLPMTFDHKGKFLH